MKRIDGRNGVRCLFFCAVIFFNLPVVGYTQSLPPTVQLTVPSTVSFSPTEKKPSLEPATIQIGTGLNGIVSTQLTLQQAYTLALTRNPAIQAARARLDEAQADVLIAKIRMNPSFVTDLGFFAEKTYRVGGILFAIEAPGKRAKRIQVAETLYEQTTYDVELSIRKTLSQIRQAYIQWMGATARLQAEQADETDYQQITALARQRYKGNEVEELDVNQASMLLMQAHNDVLEAQNTVQTSTITLQSLLNVPSVAAPPFVFNQLANVTLPPLDKLIQQAYAHRVDLKSNALAVLAERQRTDYFKRSRIPNLTIISGFDMVESVPHKLTSGTFQMGQFELPIFNRQQGNIAKATATGNRLLADQAVLQQQIRQELQINYEKVTYLQQQWQSYHSQLLPLAETVDKQALSSYKRGKTAINDVIGQHQNAYNVRIRAVDTFLNYQNALAQLEAALSQSLSNGNPGIASPAPSATGDN